MYSLLMLSIIAGSLLLVEAYGKPTEGTPTAPVRSDLQMVLYNIQQMKNPAEKSRQGATGVPQTNWAPKRSVKVQSKIKRVITSRLNGTVRGRQTRPLARANSVAALLRTRSTKGILRDCQSHPFVQKYLVRILD